ncbi:Signal transduction histidine kinase [Pseudarcicella hirudinis]|uniref:histidine kinase n=2 Tax=Pseudarcicella hirudinis TaxID=1079859 RepID=A0A1I5TP33_9BACT|nr:HAMP domain-containing sensor histidine kinase [Pseudarcicella hirudinis]SFP84864.1 Signal transduction histidine kinase [Pseudarcicella hirudinis]
MKLFRKTILYLFLASLPIALIGTGVLYWLIHKEIIHEIDELMQSDLKKVEENLMKTNPESIQLTDWNENPGITIVPDNIYIPQTLKDTIQGKPGKRHKTVPVRQLKATVKTNHHNYLVVIRQRYDEFEEMARKLSVTVVVCFLILTGILVLVELWVSRQLWKPFHAIIRQLSNYRIEQQELKDLEAGNTEEFKLLAQTLQQMTQSIRNQFLLQKQFTENASHEIQTPIAIISAELESLLQVQNLPEKQLLHIRKSSEALRRLTQLNKSLLLLTKIENNQFSEQINLNISELVENTLLLYEDFSEHKNLQVIQEILPEQFLKINPHLAEILVGNLLKNAIRYNHPGGKVICQVENNSLRIKNTGEPLPFPEKLLFSRFVKHPKYNESTGLGLAIVRQISETYHLKLSYEFDAVNAEHIFTVSW